MTNHETRDPLSLVVQLEGLECWYISCGGAAGSTFQLALGERIRRATALKNSAHSEEYRLYEGEANLLVWCSWRLDSPTGPLSSSADEVERIERSLADLRATQVRGISLTDKTWDLQIRFSNQLKLVIFCDRVSGDPSSDGNWDLWLCDRALFVGPGNHWVVEEREPLPTSPRPGKTSPP